MRGLFLLMALAVALPRAATARPMPHFDLAGLVRQSDAIVLARRTAVETPSRYVRLVHYEVERALRGAIAPGTALAFDEFLYDTDGHALAGEAVLFLYRDGHGELQLLPSGLRVVEGGKVYRFEQWSNPGGWQMVPQGHDPTDIWQTGSQPIDLAELEREIAAAGQRVAAFDAALAIADRDRRRAAILALFVPPGGPPPEMGFYRDVLANEAEQALARAGDLDGALLVSARDRTRMPHGFATAPQLAAAASDVHRPLDVRLAALRALADSDDLVGDTASVHAVLALLDDPSPDLRVAAVAAAAPRDAMSSDPAENARFHRLAREERAALARRMTRETDPAVLFALVVDAQLHTGPHGPPIVAGIVLSGAGFNVDVRCARRGVRIRTPRLVASEHGRPVALPAGISVQCGQTTTGAGSATGPVPAGRYALSLEATVNGAPFALPLGTLVAAPGGALTLSR